MSWQTSLSESSTVCFQKTLTYKCGLKVDPQVVRPIRNDLGGMLVRLIEAVSVA